MERFYKGDIIHKNIDSKGNPIDCLWSIDLMGVIQNTESIGMDKHFTLFYRPFKNKVKYFFWKNFRFKK